MFYMYVVIFFYRVVINVVRVLEVKGNGRFLNRRVFV